MTRLNTDFASFLIHDPQSTTESMALFVARPSEAEFQSLGRLFGVFQIVPGNDQARRIIDLIITSAKNFHYQQLESNVELAFENTLKQLNEVLSNEMTQGSAGWLDDCNMLLGVLKDNDLFFTQTGDIQAFLAHKMHFLNILEKTRGVESRINPLKIFSQTIAGQIASGDTIVFGTTSLLDYLSQERLRTIVQSNSAHQSCVALENLLSPNSGRRGFGALIFKLMPETVPAQSQPRPLSQPDPRGSASQESMEQLMGREESTNQLLSPSAWLNFKHAANSVRDQANRVFGKLTNKRRGVVPRPMPPAQLYVPSRDLQKPIRHTQHPSNWIIWLGRIYVGIRSIGRLGQQAARFLVGLVSGGQKVRQSLHHLPTRAANSVDAKVSVWQKLNRQRKVTLIVAIVLIFIFAEGMVIIGKQRDKATQTKAYQNAITVARQKIDEADAALLYANEDSARNLISEARAQIASIPEKQRQKKYLSDVIDIENKLGVINEKIKHVITIAEPTVLSNLADTTTGISPAGLMGLLNGKIVTAATNQKSLYVTDIESKTTTTVALPDTLASEPVVTAPLNAKQGLVLFQDNTLLQYDASNNSITPLTIEFPNQDKTLVSGAVYVDRLYFVDTKNNTILRHTRAGKAYSKGTSWLRDAAIKLDTTKALAVDGSVYILRDDGSVTKYTGGEVDSSFTLTATDPALSNPTKLYATTSSDMLYVLDPTNKRLVAYTKATGKFKQQYTSDKFDALIDFTIDPGAKKAYLLNGTMVYQIEL
ncbi:MAG: hypothetical protein WC734_01355 [Patescibacteria group bacterium]|jgi:hypothetical protein